MRLSQALVALALASLHVSAHASLINPDEYKTSSQTWLKLSETVGLSMNDFNNGVGGWNTMYRLALSEEISLMLQGLGIAQGDSGWKTTVPGASNFIYQLGGTAPGGYYAGTWGSDGNQGANGIGMGWSVMATLNNGEQGSPLSADCPAYTNCARIVATAGNVSPFSSTPITGLFVVRIPEPGTLALFGLAGGLLAFQRRRKKQ